MTGDLLPHAPLVDFVAYLRGQKYAESSILETLRQVRFLRDNFPAGLACDEDVALLEMERAILVDRRVTARSISVYRTWTRRYYRFLLSRVEVPA